MLQSSVQLTVVNSLHASNANFPIDVTDAGIETSVIFGNLNARAAMLETPFSITTFVICVLRNFHGELDTHVSVPG